MSRFQLPSESGMWSKIKVYTFGKLLIDINPIISIKLNRRTTKEMKMLTHSYNYNEMSKFQMTK